MNTYYRPYEAGSSVPEERYSETHYSDVEYFAALARTAEDNDDE